MLKSIGFTLFLYTNENMCKFCFHTIQQYQTGLYNVCLCVGRIIRINLYFSVSIISLLNSAQPYITVKQYHSPRANITGAHFLTKCASIHVFFIALAADLQFPVFLISGRNRAPQSRISCPQQAGLPYSRIKEPAGPKEITAVCRARPCGAQSR